MARFIMFYHMGDTPPSDGAAMMERWQKWLAANAANLIEAENPFGARKIVSSEGITDAPQSPTMGYGILEAETYEDALALAQSCPFLEMGTLEVCEIKRRS